MIINSFRYLKYLRSFQRVDPLICIFGPSSLYKFSTQPENSVDSLIKDFLQEYQSINGLQDFVNAGELLKNIVGHEEVDKQKKSQLFEHLMSKFPTKTDDNIDIQLISQASDVIVSILQYKIEQLDALAIINSAYPISTYHAKYFKTYWHFVEFLLTRTIFLNVFQDIHAVQLLKAYYNIESTLETDKYQYIFDKFEEYFTTKKLIELTESELAEILILYTKSLIGGDLFYRKMHDHYKNILPQFTVPNLISCNWAFVTYNLRNQDQSLRVYTPETYERISKEASSLNSYQMKQFLWSYQKEKEILPK